MTDAAGQSPAASIRRQFAIFAAIGVAGLLVDMAALWVALNPLGLDLYTGRLFSYLCAASFTWWMNREFTFKGVSRRGAVRQWGRFLAANAVGAAVNYAVYAVVIAVVPLTGLWPDEAAELIPYAGVAAGSISGLVFNFTLSRLVVFRQS
ncbi:GtrA family protein [Indioceanicola profundi]|uniref:GtrA family protein n=1 Tax=Indioceanicola profundi TaxID=2220096 RepID=UPI000E6AC5F1|nr:GtrA family protein [Indioceanicola profundi]